MRLLTPDELLSTTRSVRPRLDLDHPVPRELVERAVEPASQAPTGATSTGGTGSRWTTGHHRGARAALRPGHGRLHRHLRRRRPCGRPRGGRGPHRGLGALPAGELPTASRRGGAAHRRAHRCSPKPRLPPGEHLGIHPPGRLELHAGAAHAGARQSLDHRPSLARAGGREPPRHLPGAFHAGGPLPGGVDPRLGVPARPAPPRRGGAPLEPLRRTARGGAGAGRPPDVGRPGGGEAALRHALDGSGARVHALHGGPHLGDDPLDADSRSRGHRAPRLRRGAPRRQQARAPAALPGRRPTEPA